MQLKDQQSAQEAYTELESNGSKSLLVDVRSKYEWFEAGIADLGTESEKLILCEWRKYPSMELNENFFDELMNKVDFQEIENVYFICAAGIRSKEAANYTSKKLEEFGFSIKCINVFDGFNGNKNNFFNFGRISGWKDSGLPHCKLTQPTYEN